MFYVFENYLLGKERIKTTTNTYKISVLENSK